MDGMVKNLGSAPRIALILDNPLRDLPGICLLALELSQRGCTVFVVPMYLNDEVFSLAPDFVLLNYLRRVSQGFAEALIGNGIPFGVLDTEGGPLADMNDHLPYLCDSEHVNQATSLVCTWGREMASILEKKRFFQTGAIVVTGQPRFDIYFSPWKGISQRIAPYVTEIPSPFVLVCSNFALTGSEYGDRNQILQKMTQLYGVSEEKARAWQEEEDAAIEAMTLCVIKLARIFPGVQWLYRPHPFEKIDPYHERFSACPNIKVSKQGDISAWMIQASAVIQLNCTTSYDAWFAGTPSFKPGWITQESGMGDSLSINHRCSSFEDLVENLQRVLNKTYDLKLQRSSHNEELVHRFFGISDGRAHVRTADEILRVLDISTREQRLKNLAQVKNRVVDEARSWREKLGARIFLKIGFQSTWKPQNLKDRRKLLNRYRDSEKYFDAKRVENWVRHLSEASEKPVPEVGWASDFGAYPFGGKHGQSVVIKANTKI